MIKKNLVIILLFAISTFAFSQKIKVSGKVYNASKVGLDWVFISYTKGDNTHVVNTSSDGSYSITISSNDSITLIFKKQGYKDLQCIVLPVKQDITLDIILQIQATDLDAVTIKGANGKRSSTMIVDYQNLKRDYLLDGTIESLISTYAGVSSTNELSSQYQVRGGNFDENMVYVDGIEIYRPLLVSSAQQEGLSFINPNMVSNVKFSSGGFTSDYGDKMSSVLDVEYRKPDDIKKAEGSINAGLMGGGICVGNKTGRFSQMTGIRYKTTRTLLATTDTDAEYDPSFMDIQTLINYSFHNNWVAQFLGNYSHNKYQFTPKTRETNFGTLDQLRMFVVHFDGWENDRFLTYQGALRLRGKITDKLELGITASAFSSDEQEYYDITGSYRLDEYFEKGVNTTSSPLGVGKYHEHARNKLDADVYTISHVGNINLQNQVLKWGISYQQEKINGVIKEWEMRDSAGYSLPHTPDIINLYSNLRGTHKSTSTRYSAFIQDKYILDTKVGMFIFNAGVRTSHWSFNNETLFSPRLSIVYMPEKYSNLTFRLSTGLYYQSPFYKEYQQIVNDGVNNKIVLNNNILSQKSVHYILGSDFNFKSESGLPFKLTGEVYYKKLAEINPYTVNNVKIRYAGQNQGSGYIAGFDLRLYGEFVPGTDSWISLSLMKTQQKINGVNTPLPTDQLYNISIYFQDYFPGYDRLKVSIKGSLSEGLPVTAPYQTYTKKYFRMPAYKRLDLGFSWKVIGKEYNIRKQNSIYTTLKNLWLGLDILNLFDIKNTNSYYWIADVNNNQYAIPNYLTGRQLNIKLVADF